MTHKPRAIVFDLFGVLFRYKINNTLLVQGLLSLYLQIGGSKNIFEPIADGINILNKCHKYKRYVLSNIGKTSFSVLHSQYPTIFSSFDGIVYSGQTGLHKPDVRIYQHLLNTYQLNPEETLFIDDKKKNIEIAQQIGMIGIVCDDFAHVEQTLQKHHIF